MGLQGAATAARRNCPGPPWTTPRLGMTEWAKTGTFWCDARVPGSSRRFCRAFAKATRRYCSRPMASRRSYSCRSKSFRKREHNTIPNLPKNGEVHTDSAERSEMSARLILSLCQRASLIFVVREESCSRGHLRSLDSQDSAHFVKKYRKILLLCDPQADVEAVRAVQEVMAQLRAFTLEERNGWVVQVDRPVLGSQQSHTRQSSAGRRSRCPAYYQ